MPAERAGVDVTQGSVETVLFGNQGEAAVALVLVLVLMLVSTVI